MSAHVSDTDAHEDPSPWTYSPLFSKIRLVNTGYLNLLGQRIRQRRKGFGWTQEELADRAEIDRSYVGGVERGERNLTFSMLCQLCQALGCDVATLTQGIPGTKE